jgi:putative ABC transport system ATP-binding protein
VIELAGISRTFEVGGRPVHALQRIDLEIPDGEYLAIMGPSGSGKSTLLNILGCLDRPTEGSYRLDGQDVGPMSENELATIRGHRIGFVFQSFQLIPRLSAAENVELPMMFAGIERGDRLQRIGRALDAVGLAERAEHRPDQLSGGERQRVAIARAIVMQPSILLADEPTGNLDSTSGGEVVRLIESLNREGLTVIVVTHDPSIGGRARRLVQLRDGVKTSDAVNTPPPDGALRAPRSGPPTAPSTPRPGGSSREGP